MMRWMGGLVLGSVLFLAPHVQAQCKVCDRCSPDKLVSVIERLAKEVPTEHSNGFLPSSGSVTTFEKKSTKLRQEAKEKEMEADRLDRKEQLLDEAKKVLRDCQ